MIFESSFKLSELRKQGYSNISEWIVNPNNVYVGTKEQFINNTGHDKYKESKWINPFDSVEKYVIHLFKSGLIYEINELNGKTIGCFCHEPRKTVQKPMCNSQVLADLINRCYKPVEELIKNKRLERTKELITLTFGDAAENHKGMEQIGTKLEAGQGFNLNDLQNMSKRMKYLGVECKLVCLSDMIKEKVPEAYVLVMKGAVTRLVKNLDQGLSQIDMFNEQKTLAYDKKVFMYGRVVNKHARWNLCFDDKSRGPTYEEKKGTIVSYDEVPLMKGVREQLPIIFGKKAEGLKVESNYYYDTGKCGIGYHGDSERVKVIAIRIGYSSLPIYFQWFHEHKSVGGRIEIPLDPGDMYVMSEKAVGADWKKSSIYTLRHATGCEKYVKIK
jgi:hypothetical protein